MVIQPLMFATSFVNTLDLSCPIGELMTTARWMREFITSHHDYRRDSCVSELINYDLMCAIDRFMRGEESCRQLVGDLTSST